jgi:hypothetical protein
VKIVSALFIVLFCGISALSARADATSDLGSPSQATRDRAAAILRKTFVPTPRSHFEKLLAAVKPGQSEQSLSAFLASQHVKPAELLAAGPTWNDHYRVDGTWMLYAWGSTYPARTVAGAELVRKIEKFWIQKPRGLTGTWTEYYANGQKMYETRTDDSEGVNELWFYSNGQPWCVSTNTENTYYFHDGRPQPKDHVTEAP